MSQVRRKRVLIIDVDGHTADRLAVALDREGYDVRSTTDGDRGEQVFRQWRADVVVADLSVPEGGGIGLVRRLKAIDGRTEIIAVDPPNEPSRAVEAGQAGAFYYLEKPVEEAGLVDILHRAFGRTRERAEYQHLRDQVNGRYSAANVIGQSKKMTDLFELIERIAPSDANVLVQGENGTGKEVIANAIHHRSHRAGGPFIKINCAAIPHELIESELFGYRKGAFTGASMDKVGLFELAEGGSLLLDEIGEMPAYVQTKLLRVLQEREYRPIGSDRVVRVDFRLICDTNVDLAVALREGRLREDLYFRINTITLRVPPLRERTEDIPLLCDNFLAKFNQRYQKTIRGISGEAYHFLIRNRWPGNVRELENAIERAVLVCTGSEIQPADLPDSVVGDHPRAEDLAIPANRTLAEIEKMAIVQTLQRTNWNKQEAAQILGLYRPTLYSKIKKHRIQDPRAQRRAMN